MLICIEIVRQGEIAAIAAHSVKCGDNTAVFHTGEVSGAGHDGLRIGRQISGGYVQLSPEICRVPLLLIKILELLRATVKT